MAGKLENMIDRLGAKRLHWGSFCVRCWDTGLHLHNRRPPHREGLAPITIDRHQWLLLGGKNPLPIHSTNPSLRRQVDIIIVGIVG